jgi:hypothetical protein
MGSIDQSVFHRFIYYILPLNDFSFLFVDEDNFNLKTIV